MAITKEVYTDYQTVISASFLNNLQDEVINNCVTVDQVKSFNTTQKQNGRSQIGAASAQDVVNRTSYATCSTAASTAAKTASLDGFTLETGACVLVKFTYTNTVSAPTLNVNSTGAKAIKMYGTTAAGTNPSTSWQAGEVVRFVYDGTNWLMVKNFALTYEVVSTF